MKSTEVVKRGCAQAKKPAMIAAFKSTCSVSRACEIAGIARMTHYLWMHTDPAYAEAFEASRDEAAQVLEDEAVRRAQQGVEEPVYQGGKLVGTVQRYSDTLLIFLLNGARPDKYKQRSSVEVTGAAMVLAAIASGKKRAEGV